MVVREVVERKGLDERVGDVGVAFDKDDARVAAWLAAAADSRAKVFGLPRVDALRAVQIAGRVVPAVATATSVAAGLAALEAVKILTAPPVTRQKLSDEERRERIRQRKFVADTLAKYDLDRSGGLQWEELKAFLRDLEPAHVEPSEVLQQALLCFRMIFCGRCCAVLTCCQYMRTVWAPPLCTSSTGLCTPPP